MDEGPQRASIIVIDDDEGIRTSLANILSSRGYAVDTAGDGREALMKYREHDYDLALIDIILPGLKGTELLKETPRGAPDMLKVIVTGFPDLWNAIDSVNEGADAYVIKPFEVSELMDTIRRLLEGQAANRKYDVKKVKGFIEGRTKELVDAGKAPARSS
jgi:DNA-binding NtrC family response regulator